MSAIKRLICIAILLGTFSLLAAAGITAKSATFDEVQHFGMGRYLLLNQKWDVMGSIIHPPLGYYILSLPLLLYDDDKQAWEYEEKNRDTVFLGGVDITRGQSLLSKPENRDDRQLIACRLVVLFLAVVLGVYVYLFSSELFGVTGGLFSLFLYAFTPVILAFSGISTQDMPLTVFSFISVYYLWRYLQDSRVKHSVLSGLFLGMALAVKFTAMLLIPYEVFIYGLYLYKTKNKPSYTVLLIAGIALLVLFGSYGFKITPFLQGNEYRLAEMKRGQAAFLNGRHSNFGWWYFYLESLLIKTPIPLLLLFATSLFYLNKIKKNALTILILFTPVISLTVLFSLSPFSVGIRYLLPMFPFALVGMGVLYRQASRQMVIFTCCMALWLVFGTVHIAPHFLAYFNEVTGGADNGYRYLVDSNLDWGQDLKGLKKYMDENGIRKVSLSYFGADSPQRYGIDYDWLPSHYLYNPTPDKPYDISPDQLIAVSATNLQGVYFENRDEFAWLRKYRPLAKIGYSIFIYDPQEIIRNR
ncbi:MAG: hypothetical protein A2076_02875 [Geobacteraceae bacterium GWC2_53_11]|nr:MAG: hypothetical protein A2076_02875 [Geobacteraceae bacterium GWC2_53_11]